MGFFRRRGGLDGKKKKGVFVFLEKKKKKATFRGTTEEVGLRRRRSEGRRTRIIQWELGGVPSKKARPFG